MSLQPPHYAENITYDGDISRTEGYYTPAKPSSGRIIAHKISSAFYGVQRMLKRVMDIVGASILLFLLSPLMLIFAVLIRRDGGHTSIFRQTRNGLNGEEFTIYKFRTMTPSDEDERDFITQATPHDPRVTKLGRFMRNTSIDELPQLLNVLKGDMSLVGPRPHAVGHNDYYAGKIYNYHLRHRMKPGITGWAQVKGWRGETNTLDKMEKRVECDLYYIENWSLWFDFKVLFWTVLTVLFHKNAH